MAGIPELGGTGGGWMSVQVEPPSVVSTIRRHPPLEHTAFSRAQPCVAETNVTPSTPNGGSEASGVGIGGGPSLVVGLSPGDGIVAVGRGLAPGDPGG
ncbi:MAG: hypothetical protein HY263_03595 [Chloroflexi bacterium]|nr:hypothetical protein [Chloroflexota bacterium]